MSSTHEQGVRIFGILLGQSSQVGQSRINEPSFPTNPLELCVGQQSSPPRAPYNVEAGSSRGQRTQPIDSESGENWQFDLNEPFLRDNSGPEDGPNHSLMHCSQRDIRLPVSRFETSVAQTSPLARGPVEPSLRPLQSPASRPSNPTAAQVPLVGQSLQSHGPTEVVDLVSEHEYEDEDAEDDDGDDEDDEEEDDGGDAAASGYDDVIVSSPIASGQVVRTRYRDLRMRASNDPELVAELAAARNQRRRVNSDPQPSNSHVGRTRYRALRMRASNDPELVAELAAARNQRRRVNVDPQSSNSNAVSTRYRAPRMQASNDPGLVTELAAAQNQRRCVSNNPQPLNSNLEVAPPPPPRRPPTFECPICYGSFSEGMATRCGHIFCSDCISRALSAQSRCPTCREMINDRGLIRFCVPDPF